MSTRNNLFLRRKPIAIRQKAKEYLEELSPTVISPNDVDAPKFDSPECTQSQKHKGSNIARLRNLEKYINDLSTSSEEARKVLLKKRKTRTELFKHVTDIGSDIPSSVFRSSQQLPTSTPLCRAALRVENLTISPIEYANKQVAVVVLRRSPEAEECVKAPCCAKENSRQTRSNCNKELFSCTNVQNCDNSGSRTACKSIAKNDVILDSVVDVDKEDEANDGCPSPTKQETQKSVHSNSKSVIEVQNSSLTEEAVNTSANKSAAVTEINYESPESAQQTPKSNSRSSNTNEKLRSQRSHLLKQASSSNHTIRRSNNLENIVSKLKSSQKNTSQNTTANRPARDDDEQQSTSSDFDFSHLKAFDDFLKFYQTKTIKSKETPKNNVEVLNKLANSKHKENQSPLVKENKKQKSARSVSAARKSQRISSKEKKTVIPQPKLDVSAARKSQRISSKEKKTVISQPKLDDQEVILVNNASNRLFSSPEFVNEIVNGQSLTRDCENIQVSPKRGTLSQSFSEDCARIETPKGKNARKSLQQSCPEDSGRIDAPPKRKKREKMLQISPKDPREIKTPLEGKIRGKLSQICPENSGRIEGLSKGEKTAELSQIFSEVPGEIVSSSKGKIRGKLSQICPENSGRIEAPSKGEKTVELSQISPEDPGEIKSPSKGKIQRKSSQICPENSGRIETPSTGENIAELSQISPEDHGEIESSKGKTRAKSSKNSREDCGATEIPAKRKKWEKSSQICPEESLEIKGSTRDEKATKSPLTSEDVPQPCEETTVLTKAKKSTKSKKRMSNAATETAAQIKKRGKVVHKQIKPNIEESLRRSCRTRKQPEFCYVEYIYVSPEFFTKYNKDFEDKRKKANRKNSKAQKKKIPAAEVEMVPTQDSGISSISRTVSMSLPSTSSSKNLRSAQKVLETSKEALLSPICESTPAVVENKSCENQDSERPEPEEVKYSWLARAPIKLRSTKEDNLLSLGVCLNDRKNSITTGFFCLKGNGFKPYQTVTKHNMLYLVQEGTAEVKVEDDVAVVKLHDSFLVTVGKKYSIRNLSSVHKVLLYYTKILPNKLEG